jgi:hypothetical protein
VVGSVTGSLATSWLGNTLQQSACFDWSSLYLDNMPKISENDLDLSYNKLLSMERGEHGIVHATHHYTGTVINSDGQNIPITMTHAIGPKVRALHRGSVQRMWGRKWFSCSPVCVPVCAAASGSRPPGDAGAS